jgi:hypothetical protein
MLVVTLERTGQGAMEPSYGAFIYFLKSKYYVTTIDRLTSPHSHELYDTAHTSALMNAIVSYVVPRDKLSKI